MAESHFLSKGFFRFLSFYLVIVIVIVRFISSKRRYFTLKEKIRQGSVLFVYIY